MVAAAQLVLLAVLLLPVLLVLGPLQACVLVMVVALVLLVVAVEVLPLLRWGCQVGWGLLWSQ